MLYNKFMNIGLIPSRLKSKRLNKKPLLVIDGLPMVVHTFKRALLSKLLDRVIVCTDHKSILDVVKRHGGEAMLTSAKHKNGTERIHEVSKKFGKNDLIIDIQGDQPLVDPKSIDETIKFHKKNHHFDIVLPTLKFKNPDQKNIVKVVSDKLNKVLYLSRSTIPYSFKKKPKFYNKHLSIISFKPEALKKYCMYKESYLEKIEGVELLRALENDIKIGSFKINKDIFSVDIKKDYLKAISLMPLDPIRKKYK